MTLWSPIWRVTIEGQIYTNFALANMTITSGRTNIYEQAQAGYVSINLINLDQSTVSLQINNSVTIELKDTAGVFTPIFGGTVSDFTISVTASGSIAVNQTVSIIALGTISRMQKALTEGVLPNDQDGDQILLLLQDLLLNNWSEVPAAFTWATYDPTEQWQDAQNVGLGEIDTPGNYDLHSRTAQQSDIYSLVAGCATSGLGYIYETPTGAIGYADSTHRSSYLAVSGYTDLDAAQALSNGIAVQTRAGDIRNSIVLNYGNNSASQTAQFKDAASIASYGQLGQVISTTLKNAGDANVQAAFYLTLRAYPQAMFNQITFELTSPELDNADRDSLINIFMGLPLRISNLPLNMAAGQYLGFVEGWSWAAAYNSISVTILLSPLAYSIQAMAWQDVSVAEAWNTISGILDWENALVVA